MAHTFLTAEWRNLIMANYSIDPSVLKKYVPFGTELDTYDGVHYVSLVGFLFKNTRVKGFRIPFHHTFEEVNLRFYVRYKDESQWKRGVVFIKELVPKSMITFVANTVYKEKYATHQMKHSWSFEDNKLDVSYFWKVKGEWNFIKVVADKEPKSIPIGSAEEFITEHYWGYTFINNTCTGSYEVLHPKWRIHPVQEYTVHCNVAELYGSDFTPFLQQEAASVFLAEGSAIEVKEGSKLFLK